MWSLFVSTLAWILLIFGGSCLHAQEWGLDNATLGCMVNPTASIYLFQEEKAVLVAMAEKDAIPLRLEKFEVYRCPGCFGFAGTVDSHRYEGQTEGVQDGETGRWAVFMDLVIDGGQS